MHKKPRSIDKLFIPKMYTSTVLLIFISVAVGDTLLPHLFCTNINSDCRLYDVFLFRFHPRYKVISTAPYSDIEGIAVNHQQLAVLSRDFCETFPRLVRIDASYSNVEILEENAFTSCHSLEGIFLYSNKIQSLMPNIFQNNAKLTLVNFNDNRIGHISDELFQNNRNLDLLGLKMNRLQQFPVSAVKNCKKLTSLTLHTNDIYELDAEGFVVNLPELSNVALNGNMFPCSVIGEMLEVFRSKNVTLSSSYTRKDRPFTMSTEAGFMCIRQ